MGRLVYAMNTSLDGFVETVEGRLEWGRMDEELHSWWNDEARGAAAFLYGRRMYELMAAYWPTAAADPAATPAEIEFGRIWNATPKVVFSRTLAAVEGNSRLAGGDVVEELARLRGEHRGELAVGGPTLAAAFLERGLVDELRLAVHPVILGAGTPFLPPGLRLDLRLLGTRVFASGVIALRYAVDARPSA